MIRRTATPFLKWAGGKTQLLGEILPKLPENIDTYFEPFIGGGAVFFALASEGRFDRAVISDGNPALVEVYKVLRDHPDALIALLLGHQDFAKDEDYYYEIRAQSPKELSPVERAARILFLNKTCYNGLYRVNRRGEFNVPFGRYANPRVVNEAALEAASYALRGVEIVHSDFEAMARRAGAGDAIYFDPPYVPLSPTSSFTSYHSDAFTHADHLRLTRAYVDCARRGAVAVLSNSDCPVTRELYQHLDVETVTASRAINSVGGKRGRVTEVLVVGAGRAATSERFISSTPRPAAALRPTGA